MRKSLIILPILLLLTAPAAHAGAKINWKAQFSGLTGVSISCVRTIKKKYAARVCQKLMNHAASGLKNAGISHSVGETVLSKSKDTPPVLATSITHPLNLTIHVRATNPGPMGMDVRVNASVTYRAALEQGDDRMSPRSGELLIWQTGATAAGTGGSKKLERAMVGAIKKRMDAILELLDENWPR